MMAASAPASAQQQQGKPNILFIMADDIGWMQVQTYAMGLGVGETPNIDRLATEGMKNSPITMRCKVAPPDALPSPLVCIRFASD